MSFQHDLQLTSSVSKAREGSLQNYKEYLEYFKNNFAHNKEHHGLLLVE